MPIDSSILTVLAVAAVFIIFLFVKYAHIVPQNEVYVIERRGKYHETLGSGFHLLLPFLDRVAYKHTLKEQVIDVPPQTCITRDNISVEVDGVLYLTVIDPKLASYFLGNNRFAAYRFASIQIAKTTMRSVIGKLELEQAYEERESINADIIDALGKASEHWGIQVSRYEVRNITPPPNIKDAVERHLKAD